MKSLATGQIRFDHTHVMTLFHRYKPDTSPDTKQGLVRNACAALEIHAQLEEEIFYPALSEAGIDPEVIAKSVPEHDEMRRQIARLRSLAPTDPAYDDTFMELMRDVIHHVADEETTLLPHAERMLPRDRLADIGREMAQRRVELVRDRAGEIGASFGQMIPKGSLLLAGGALLAGTWMLARSRANHRPDYRGEYEAGHGIDYRTGRPANWRAGDRPGQRM